MGRRRCLRAVAGRLVCCRGRDTDFEKEKVMRNKSVAVDYGMIVIGTVLMSMGIKKIFDPANMVTCLLYTSVPPV